MFSQGPAQVLPQISPAVSSQQPQLVTAEVLNRTPALADYWATQITTSGIPLDSLPPGLVNLMAFDLGDEWRDAVRKPENHHTVRIRVGQFLDIVHAAVEEASAQEIAMPRVSDAPNSAEIKGATDAFDRYLEEKPAGVSTATPDNVVAAMKQYFNAADAKQATQWHANMNATFGRELTTEEVRDISVQARADIHAVRSLCESALNDPTACAEAKREAQAFNSLDTAMRWSPAAYAFIQRRLQELQAGVMVVSRQAVPVTSTPIATETRLEQQALALAGVNAIAELDRAAMKRGLSAAQEDGMTGSEFASLNVTMVRLFRLARQMRQEREHEKSVAIA